MPGSKAWIFDESGGTSSFGDQTVLHGGPFLGEAIGRVAVQAYPDFKVTVVNDGSPGTTRADITELLTECRQSGSNSTGWHGWFNQDREFWEPFLFM
jgi:hypothetical protein